MTTTTTTTAAPLSAEQLDRLEKLARAADQAEGQHIYIHWRDANNWEANLAWHNAASPAVFLALIAQARAAGQAEPCVICGADEPRTGTCGSDDARALCNRSTPQATAPQPSVGEQADELHIGMSNNDQGVHVNIIQRHADRTSTVIFSAKVPAGDSYARAALAQRASSAPADDKHLPGWERGIATVTMTGHQLREALDFINPDGDDDNEQRDNWLTFGIVQHKDDEGKASTGMCCWNDDSDGVLPLDGDATVTDYGTPTATPASASGELLTDQQIKDIAFDITHGDHQDDPHGYDIALDRAVERHLRRAPSPSREEAPAAQAVEARPELTVWYGPMRESNGKSNFTALLLRKGSDVWDGITIDRSEYPDRVRYEADRVRYLIGELAERPDILDYDANKHSGYVAPAASVAQAEDTARLEFIATNGSAIRDTTNGTRNLFVWGFDFPEPGAGRVENLRARIDAMASTQHSAKAGGLTPHGADIERMLDAAEQDQGAKAGAERGGV